MTKIYEPYFGRFLLAFILTNIIFISFFLFTFSVSYLNYQRISSQNNLIQSYIIELSELTNKTINEDICEDKLFEEASEKLDFVGSRIGLLENKFGKKDPRVIEQKELYNELEIKHFEIIKDLKSKCHKEFITILFFYSNNEPFDKESEKIGFILSTFKNEDSQRIMIYSFDFDTEYKPIETLKNSYKINKNITILVNEKYFVEVDNIKDLEVYL